MKHDGAVAGLCPADRPSRSIRALMKPPSGVIVCATKGSRGQLTLDPPLVLHDAGTRRFSEKAEGIINGGEEFVRGLGVAESKADQHRDLQ